MRREDRVARISLVVDGLIKRFGSLTAVSELSFEVQPGSVVGLLGPNGAGKTTTLACLAGLLRPDAGSFSLDGVVLGSERGRKIALIPETPDVYPMLTVWEHLVFIAKSCRLDDSWPARARGLLERLDLTSKRDALGESLSKGMRQKTLIACTLLADAPVLLLDEPMIGLDPRGQRELRELIAGLRPQGKHVVVSTHLLASAESMCDRVVILKDGTCVLQSSVEALRERRAEATLEDVFFELTE